MERPDRQLFLALGLAHVGLANREEVRQYGRHAVAISPSDQDALMQ